MSGAFARVLVPVEFEYVDPDEADPERTIEVGDHERVSVGACTICALELAAKLAEGGEVHVVHAIREFTNYATWSTPARLNELEDDASRSSIHVLAGIAEQHCPGVTLHYVIKPGKPLDVILESATELSPDAIVLAASARGIVSRAFLGSTADKVIRHASCPVVVVPSGAAPGDASA